MGDIKQLSILNLTMKSITHSTLIFFIVAKIMLGCNVLQSTTFNLPTTRLVKINQLEKLEAAKAA